MNAVLSTEDRAQIRRIAARAEKIVSVRVRWEALILDELATGPSPRLELASIIRPRYTREDRVALHGAVRRLLAKGLIRERPMIEPAGRAVKIDPVIVLELTELTESTQ